MSVQGAPPPPSTNPSVQEFSIRVPKNVKKKYQVMRFTSSVNMDFSKWSQVKIERENNMREFKGNEEEIPKYGAGSEFGRDAREEARRKKYGIVSKKYRPEDQPWILKVGGKTGKKFRGIREGGVTENAAYYVFTHSPDGGIDAFPLTEWYNFQPIQRYKALTAEEAEEEFGRRNKNWNLFSLMMRKRLNGGEEVEGEEPEEGKGKKSSVKKKELKISDMDDWVDSEDDSGSNSNSEEEKQDKEEKPNKKGTKKGAPVKKKKKASDDEAFEESDDGDEEGREVDYISDSSESESDHEGKVNKQLQGVAEEDALRKLLSSGEEDEDEEKKDDADKESETEDKEKAKTDVDKSVEKEKKSGSNSGKKTKKKKLVKKVKKEDGNETSSDFSSDSSESDSDSKKKQNKDTAKGSKEVNSAGSSRSGTPTKDVLGGPTATPEKRKASAILELNALKKARLDNFASATLAPYTGDSRITEDAVRRYLMRKPMTTTELLQKFKSKKTGLTSDQLVNIMTQILKRINPVKQIIKDKMYLSIKA